jgi:hypothetical protein
MEQSTSEKFLIFKAIKEIRRLLLNLNGSWQYINGPASTDKSIQDPHTTYRLESF